MNIHTNADKEVREGGIGPVTNDDGDFFLRLKSNRIGPKTLGQTGGTGRIEIHPRTGGPIIRFADGLVEQRDPIRGYRMVGRQLGTEQTPDDVVNSDTAKRVGDAATGSIIGKLLSVIGL